MSKLDGRFEKGEHRSLKTEFKRGQTPHNKGKTLEELYGIQKAKILRKKLSLQRKGVVRKDLSKRFWDKVKKTDTCWNWTSVINHGYGSFNYQGRMHIAHRFAWYLIFGKKPTQWLLHKCDNKKCVNPDHLYEGTPKDNVRDMWERGRARLCPAKGEKHGMVKLTELQVLEIRKLAETKKYLHRELAKQFNVTRTNISDIIKRRIWKHI